MSNRGTQMLGKYQLIEELGRGAFATVYRALDTTLDREVALKVLHPQLLTDPTFVERFKREARALAGLRHPHIVTVYEIGEVEGRLFIAMELAQGPSLKQTIFEQGRISLEEACTLMKSVCEALDYAQKQGVVHRDLKPSNILLDEDRGPILTDFGFAKLVGESSVSVSISGGILGTPAYIAPEVWEGRGATSATDIYALGCVLFEMLIGAPLFKGDSPPAVMKAHYAPHHYPKRWPEGVPTGVVKVLERALAKDPSARYFSARAFLADLCTLVKEEPEVEAMKRTDAGLQRTRAGWPKYQAEVCQQQSRKLGTLREVVMCRRATVLTIAIGIIVLVAIVAMSAYRTLGPKAQFEGVKAQVEQEAQLALSSSVISETREHWEAVLEKAEQANALSPGDERIAELQDQARKAIDDLDGVVRLALVELANFGSGDMSRRLIAHRQTVFVLDPAAGWVAQVNFGLTPDGILVGQSPTALVNTGMRIEGGTVGGLVDLVWVEAGSGRMASGLVVLEEGGGLVNYDPAWSGEEGEPHLTRSFLDTTPKAPKAIGSFEGRLYVLDSGEGQGQVWRYDPQGEVYPDPPGHYFSVAPVRPLVDAIDMAIDPNIYVLRADGEISKYLAGEIQPFDTSSVPDGFSQPVALAVDQDGSSGRVYVADRGHQRVVALEADGTFCAQFRTEKAFDHLEAWAVDEAAGRFYVFSGGRLYVGPFPLIP